MQTMLDLIGSSFAHNAMNTVDITATNGSGAPIAGAAVTGDCGDGVRNFGTTDATGYLEVRVPHVTCDFKVANANATGVGQRRRGRTATRRCRSRDARRRQRRRHRAGARCR